MRKIKIFLQFRLFKNTKVLVKTKQIRLEQLEKENSFLRKNIAKKKDKTKKIFIKTKENNKKLD